MRLFKIETLLPAIIIASSMVSQALATPVMTPFKPDRDGFKFVNTFSNDAVPELNIRTAGLCGGMSYAALDYYFAHITIPQQDYRPANKTQLQQYLYARQMDSILPNVDRWAELNFNPGGARNNEFFSWGLGAGRITELKMFIDQGRPVVLGLLRGLTDSHQVVAIGYDLGRYRGDLGNYKEDFKIFVYDPNHPGEIKTLIPRLSTFTYVYADDPTQEWRTYFVDGKYSRRIPIAIKDPVYPNDGKIHELLLRFYTGADDLRGGNDNVYVTVKLKNGAMYPFPNVNQSARWLSNYDETIRIILPVPVARADLDSVMLYTSFGGGISGDNWDMAKLVVRGIGNGFDQTLRQHGYKRFSGKDTLIVPVPVPPVTPTGYANTIVAHFTTGADDLRGGNDNINMTVLFRDGTRQVFNTVNGTSTWPNGSQRWETLFLTKAIKPEHIIQVSITSTFGGGISGDNWNMDAVELHAKGNGVNQKIGQHGAVRFSGIQTLNISTRPM